MLLLFFRLFKQQKEEGKFRLEGHLHQEEEPKMANSSQESSSTSAFVSSLIINGIIFLIFMSIFVYLRPKQRNVYEPKTMDLKTLKPIDQPPQVPQGAFAWLPFILTKPREFLVQYCGVDAYFFLRYLLIFTSISFMGCIILFPILLPVNATNGHNLKGFELLSFSNVSNKWRFFAHVFLSWIYFGFILFIIYKELIFYTTFRHSLQTTPFYNNLLSSRTILLTDIADEFNNETELKNQFPNLVKTWYAKDYKELEELVKERTKLAAKYEGALNKVISKGVKLQRKLIKKNKPLPEQPQDYIKKQPTHRLGKIPFIGEKVETIDYAINKLSELDEKIEKLQANYKENDNIGSVFIEFANQLEAQKAYQSIKFNSNFKSSKYYIGIPPDDIVWENLDISKKSRVSKRILANTFLTLMIIFWAIPVAVVGAISNINFLTDKVHFLRFINNCPDVILGLITGMLPSILLAVLMSLVPVVIKKAAKISGAITKQEIELYCQSWYYGFQVIQVFLVMTLASAATSTVTAIINDPSSAWSLLSENIPKASNFYIVYFILLGLSFTGGTFLRLVPLLLSKILAFLKNTPRKKWDFQNKLSTTSWGVIYPVYQLLICIFIIYSIISPILLVFSTVGLVLIYIAFLYFMIYINGFDYDLKGRNYPKALMHTFVGLYLAEVCLFALFIMAKTWGPLVLEIVMIVVTVGCHLYFQRIFFPLYDAVPISALNQGVPINGFEDSVYPMKDQGLKEIKEVGENYPNNVNVDQVNDTDANQHLRKESEVTQNLGKDDDTLNHASTASNYNTNTNSDKVFDADIEKQQQQQQQQQEQYPPQVPTDKDFDLDVFAKQLKSNPVGITKSFFSPRIGYSFSAIRNNMPPIFNLIPKYNQEYLDLAYVSKAVTDDVAHIWVPKDSIGISQYEKELAKGKVDIYDEGNTEFNEKGKYEVVGLPPSYEEAIRS